jgi:hypothetical protein
MLWSSPGDIIGEEAAGCPWPGPHARSPCLLQEAWKHAIEKAKHMPDPWAEFHLEDIATEHATRHRSAVCPRGFEESLREIGVGGDLGSCFWSKKRN